MATKILLKGCLPNQRDPQKTNKLVSSAPLKKTMHIIYAIHSLETLETVYVQEN